MEQLQPVLQIPRGRASDGGCHICPAGRAAPRIPVLLSFRTGRTLAAPIVAGGGTVLVSFVPGAGSICPPLRLLPDGQLGQSFTREFQRSMLLECMSRSSVAVIGVNVLFPIPKPIIVCANQLRRLDISAWLNLKGRLVERYIANAITKTPQSTPTSFPSPCCGVCWARIASQSFPSKGMSLV